MWLDSMPGEVELEVMQSLRQLSVLAPVARWGLCSGWGLASVFLNCLSEVLSEKYGIRLPFEHCLECEIKPEKQAFLIAQHDPPFL
eukprot:172495-Pyramimonas_sp.AAC.1